MDWLVAIGVKGTMLTSHLQKACLTKGIIPTFTSQSLRNQTRVPVGQIDLDATNLSEWISKRRIEHGLYGDIYAPNGFLEHSFFVFKAARELWNRQGGGRHTLIVDTTHIKMCYNLKLLLFVSMDREGNSRILAAALLSNEFAESFKWAFKQFDVALGLSPDIILSDQCASIRKAVLYVWPALEDLHLLCTFHLFNNFRDALMRFLVPIEGTLWETTQNAFWRFAKNADSRGVERFDAEWDVFATAIRSALLRDDGTHSEAAAKALTILDRLYYNCKRWVACWTWTRCTWGAHSTQRIESLNCSVKDFVDGCKLVTQLAEWLEVYEFIREYRMIGMTARSTQARLLGNASSVMYQIQRRVEQMNNYAYGLLCVQGAQHGNYDAEFDSIHPEHGRLYRITRMSAKPSAADDSEKPYLADFGLPGSWDSPYDNRLTSMTWCSCLWFSMIRIPCRHILKVLTVERVHEIPDILIDRHWYKVDHSTGIPPVADPSPGFIVPFRTSAEVSEHILDDVPSSLDERAILLSKECDVLIHLAKTTRFGTGLVRSVLRDGLEQLRRHHGVLAAPDSGAANGPPRPAPPSVPDPTTPQLTQVPGGAMPLFGPAVQPPLVIANGMMRTNGVASL
eukprot:2992191-Rhodomonas_salina.1